MNRIKTPANIPGGRAQLEALASTVAGFNARQMQGVPDNLSSRGSRPPEARHNEFMHKSEMNSNDGVSNNLNNSIQYSRGAELIGARQHSKD